MKFYNFLWKIYKMCIKSFRVLMQNVQKDIEEGTVKFLCNHSLFLSLIWIIITESLSNSAASAICKPILKVDHHIFKLNLAEVCL